MTTICMLPQSATDARRLRRHLLLDCPAQSQGPDARHAVRVSKGLAAYRIVTTEEVLTELLNYFGARGPYFRSAAAKLVERMQADRLIQILPQTRESFLAGLRLYTARPDKGYSLTDCISMEAMRREGLSEVLTNDEHFTQEGFPCPLEP